MKPLRWFFWGGFFLIAVASANARAESRLIIYSESSHDLEAQKLSALAGALAESHLKWDYQKIKTLSGENANLKNLKNALQGFSASTQADFLILSFEKRSSLTPQQIEGLKTQGAIRTVYIFAPESLELALAFKKIGAYRAIGRRTLGELPGVFLPRLLRRWSEGVSIEEAEVEAYSAVRESKRAFGRFIGPSTGNRFSHSDAEKNSIYLFNALAPGLELNPDLISTIQDLIKEGKNIVWNNVRDLFPSPEDPDISLGIEPGFGPVDPKNEIWIDGQALRFLAGSLLKVGPDTNNTNEASSILDGLLGIRLARMADEIRISLHFDRPVETQLRDPERLSSLQLYGVGLPQVLRLSLRLREDTLVISDLSNDRMGSIYLLVKMPVVSDTIYFRSAELNLSNWSARIEAGMVGNFVALVADGQVESTRLTGGIDYWQTLARNNFFLNFPFIIFRYLLP